MLYRIEKTPYLNNMLVVNKIIDATRREMYQNLPWILHFRGVLEKYFLPNIKASVHKMVKHTLKILHNLLQDFERVFNLFVDIIELKLWLSNI